MNKSNIPAIRFAGFTDPWEQRKLKDVADSFEYGLNAAAKEFDGTNKYLRITDIDDASRAFSDDDLTSPDTDLATADNYRLQNGDVLFARTGASVGKSYIYRESDGRVYFAGFLIRARIKPENSAEFVFQNTLTSQYEKYILITSQRSGQPGVNAQEYGEYSILMPDYSEQEKIGDFLRKIDNLNTLHQRKYESLMQIKKSMLRKMFPCEESRYPEVRFAGFTDAWEQRKLGEIVTVFSGRDYKHLSEGSIPVYGTGGYMLSVSEALSYNQDAIGIGRKGTIDKPYVLKAPFWTVDTLFYAVPEHSECLDFVYDVFQIIDWKKKDESTGVPSLSKEAINNTDVMAPNTDEQLVIGSFFTRIDHLITLHQRKYETLQRVKKSLLQKMFV